MQVKPTNIDSYIAYYPENIRILLEEMRTTILQAAPELTEAISYAMPTFKYYGNVVHFAACANHIGFYPAPSAIIEFKNKLVKYKTSKGCIQFPLNQPLPFKLITEIVQFRVAENIEKESNKKKINTKALIHKETKK